MPDSLLEAFVDAMKPLVARADPDEIRALLNRIYGPEVAAELIDRIGSRA
jgi:hypothetical protein